MKLQGQCPNCGNVHHVQLSVDPEVDLDAVVQLSAAIDKNDVITASPDLVRALAEAGTFACPATPRGKTLGGGPGGVVYT